MAEFKTVAAWEPEEPIGGILEIGGIEGCDSKSPRRGTEQRMRRLHSRDERTDKETTTSDQPHTRGTTQHENLH